MKIGKKYLIVPMFLLVGAFAVSAHPYYVSICQVEFNRETHALEIALKTFADDLLLGLENAGHEELFLGEERENPETDQFIANYVKSKLQFSVNGNTVKYNFIGKELEDGVVWSYMEITNVDDLHSLDVKCTLLTEIYETQNNVIQVEKDKKIKNLLLNIQKQSGRLEFGN